MIRFKPPIPLATVVQVARYVVLAVVLPYAPRITAWQIVTWHNMNSDFYEWTNISQVLFILGGYRVCTLDLHR